MKVLLDQINHNDLQELMKAAVTSLHQTVIVTYDQKGTILSFWGNDVERRYGIPADKIIGMTLEDFYPPELAQARISRIRQVAETGKLARDTYCVTFPAGDRCLETSLSPARIDGQTIVVAIVRDITEQKETQAALERKNIALSELLSSIETEKEQIARRVQANIDRLVVPMLHELKRTLSSTDQTQIEAVLHAVNEIASPFASQLTDKCAGLTPAEMRISHLIASGMSTKDIARIQNVATATISKHRESIRRKLDLTGKDLNLVTYLQSLLQNRPEPRPESTD